MKTLELSNTSQNVKKTDKQNSSNEIMKYKNIEDTPFTIVSQNKEHFGIIGNHRITESYKNIEELEKNLKEFSWNKVTQVIWAIVEKFKETNNLNN